jgi:hypothetical protein
MEGIRMGEIIIPYKVFWGGMLKGIDNVDVGTGWS